MKMNCIAVDDEVLALKKIKRYAEKIDYLNLMGTFDNALSTFSFLRENHIDLIFLDIQMDEFTGIQLLETIKWDNETRKTMEKDQADEDGHVNRWKRLLNKTSAAGEA